MQSKISSLIKNYYITISLQKNSSVHKFILDGQQILESHDLNNHAYQKKMIQVTFSFPKLVSVCKNQYILSVRSSDTAIFTAQNMKFPLKDFFNKCGQILKKLRIWSHLMRKSFMGNFIFCVVFRAL